MTVISVSSNPVTSSLKMMVTGIGDTLVGSGAEEVMSTVGDCANIENGDNTTTITNKNLILFLNSKIKINWVMEHLVSHYFPNFRE